MVIDLLLALVFAVGAWGMALWISAEVSLSKAQNRVQSAINVGFTVAIQAVYVLSVQTVGTWRDALLVISVMLLLAWYGMLGLTKAMTQSSLPKARGLARLSEWLRRLELSGHRIFAFVALLLMGLAALIGFGDPTLVLTISLPFAATLFCTLWVPRWLRRWA
ncbi:hypothetical protein [Meiothermus hypogaeus]|uniref:Transmembrane protein n=2 Tax=Meiothermus hypogaeus TaxID=884155 RepID=A0A511R1K2_9DEIN|nr:hypothetical protein [Meiothermus hypogaeus]RIH75780.1 hypothetical protein Mhypo_02759 [Meiothermus hypogaeus]GEM83481.1 hypothetical protein MHY01S_16470 [Meiothermus hypogaeus NBRC 106114]